MKMNRHLLQINRNFVVCSIVSASLSAIIAQLLSGLENHLTATVTIATGYVIYFAIFSYLFYLGNKNRYRQMRSSLIRKEIFSIISSFGVGEIVFLVIRWPTFYYFLEADIEPYLASLVSEIIATACYMMTVTLFLRKTKTF
jgi:hypothetical protein